MRLGACLQVMFYGMVGNSCRAHSKATGAHAGTAFGCSHLANRCVWVLVCRSCFTAWWGIAAGRTARPQERVQVPHSVARILRTDAFGCLSAGHVLRHGGE